MSETTGTYKLPYECSNCGCHFDAEIRKGQMAPDVAICTNCGCNAGHRPRKRVEHAWEDDLPTWPKRRRWWDDPHRPMCAVSPMRGGYGEGAR